MIIQVLFTFILQSKTKQTIHELHSSLENIGCEWVWVKLGGISVSLMPLHEKSPTKRRQNSVRFGFKINHDFKCGVHVNGEIHQGHTSLS